VKLGAENRKQTIAAAVLGVLLLLIVAYEFMPSSSTIASTEPATTATGLPASPTNAARPAPHRGSASTSGKKERTPQSLDPTLHIEQLASIEQIKYEGSGRNIFISQAEEVLIPKVIGKANTDNPAGKPWGGPPPIPQPPPIPLKFFWLREPARRTQEDFPLQGRGCFHCRRGRDCRPAVQSGANLSYLGGDSGRSRQRSAAEHTANAGVGRMW